MEINRKNNHKNNNRKLQTFPNTIRKTDRPTIFHNLILFGIMLQSVSYIPFIVKIYHTKEIRNLPYSTIILQLVALVFSLSIAFSKKYFFHALFFVIYTVTVVYLLFLKIKHTNHYERNNDNIFLL